MTDIASPVPAPAAGAEPPPISRAIYGMPMFATLLARDLAAIVSARTRRSGFLAVHAAVERPADLTRGAC
jgi:hypothetical protein